MDQHLMGRQAEGNCRVRDKTILGDHTEGGSVFSWNYKAEMHTVQSTFPHFAQVFICFWPSKSKVCVIFVLFSLWDTHNDSLAEFPPGACYMLRDGEAKRGTSGKKTKRERCTWLSTTPGRRAGMMWANDVVLKLAKHCEQRTLSLDGLWLVRPRHRIFQTCDSRPAPPAPVSSAGMKLVFLYSRTFLDI